MINRGELGKEANRTGVNVVHSILRSNSDVHGFRLNRVSMLQVEQSEDESF